MVYFIIRSEGSVWLLTPMTVAAETWVTEHLGELEKRGVDFVVEDRNVRDIALKIMDNGCILKRYIEER